MSAMKSFALVLFVVVAVSYCSASPKKYAEENTSGYVKFYILAQAAYRNDKKRDQGGALLYNQILEEVRWQNLQDSYFTAFLNITCL